jgi:serine phosphatase RsbU (regulator of sigma subunit)
MAVIDGDQCLGLCSREAVGLVLGTLYGRACFARDPVAGHLLEEVLRISTDQSLTDILQLVSAREGDHFFEDVLLTDQNGRFQGLIPTQSFIQLQHHMLKENILELELTNRKLDQRNRQMENELQLARELQLSILPRNFPELNYGAPPNEMPVEFQHRYRPSGTVGGDFFQLFPLEGKRAGIFLCDVMGHGVQAALITAMIRALMESLQPVAENPGRLMEMLNRELVQMLKGSDSSLFATAFYLVIDCQSEELVFASAGHPPGFHLQRQAQEIRPLTDPEKDGGPPIGIMPEAVYGNLTYVHSPKPGDILLLFTDGLYEIFDDQGKQLGYEGLQSILLEQRMLPLGRVLDGTLEVVQGYAKGQKPDDDICILGLQWGRTAD